MHIKMDCESKCMTFLSNFNWLVDIIHFVSICHMDQRYCLPFVGRWYKNPDSNHYLSAKAILRLVVPNLICFKKCCEDLPPPFFNLNYFICTRKEASNYILSISKEFGGQNLLFVKLLSWLKHFFFNLAHLFWHFWFGSLNSSLWPSTN